MTPAYNQSGVTIYHGNAKEVLSNMADGSINCCITSPPYWGLRDYGTATWEGGAADCDHTYRHGVQGKSGDRADRTHTGQAVYKLKCRRCGAKRVDEQLGLEETPEAYIAKMVAVFREVRRVLRDDGTLWLNLGDSYNAHPGQRKTTDAAGPKQVTNEGAQCAPSRYVGNLKPKDLVGIPWRVAFALQSDGWWLRSDIIWAKPAPMPESVTDRPTRSHEYIFLLTKRERYYYDHEAIKEPAVCSHSSGNGRGARGSDEQWKPGPSVPKSGVTAVEMRNLRDVWTIGSEPFSEAHFATFPPKLIEPCVIGGCPPGGTILDPFSGAATTALVAKENGRKCIGIELNLDYIKMSSRRLAQEVFAFSDGDPGLMTSD